MTIATELMNEKRWSIQWLEYLVLHAPDFEVRDAAEKEMERRAAKECLTERVSTGLQAAALCGMLVGMAYVLSPDRAYAATEATQMFVNVLSIFGTISLFASVLLVLLLSMIGPRSPEEQLRNDISEMAAMREYRKRQNERQPQAERARR